MLAMKTMCQRCRTVSKSVRPQRYAAMSVHSASTAQLGWAGRIGSYFAWRKPSGVLELSDAERDLISQIKGH